MTRVIPLTVIVLLSAEVQAQPKGPQPWWPVQPRPLPFVHPLFTDDMVLQRDIRAPLWGWSTPGDIVTISIDGKASGKQVVAAQDGKWMTKVGPLPAGGPHTITVTGTKQKATLKNVLVGDVWLCSGQSNMNWPVRLSLNGEEEVKKANHPDIRSFTVNFYSSLVPMKLPPPARWEVCKPEFARNFSGVGYFFAREIHNTRKVPIGIIHSSAGATYGEVWVSEPALRKHMPDDFKKELALTREAAGERAESVDYFAELERWTAVVDSQSAKLRYIADPDLKTTDWLDVVVPKPWQEAGLADHHGLV